MFYIVLLSVFLWVSNTHAFIDSDQYGEYSVLPPISIEYNSSGISVKYYWTTKWQESAVSSIVNVEQMWIQPLTSTSVAIHLVREWNLNGYSRTISNLNSSVYVSSWYTWSTKDTGIHIMDYDSDELFFQIWNEDVYYFSWQELPIPTNLTQSISMPDPNDTEWDGDYKLQAEAIGSGTTLWLNIGKHQSGSGVILRADIENPDNKEYKLLIQYERNGVIDTYTGGTVSSGTTLETILPYSGTGTYIWKAAVSNPDETLISDWVDFENTETSADFTLFEGFEPYPFGYRFDNSSPDYSILTGSLTPMTMVWSAWIDDRSKIPWSKWEIFEIAYWWWMENVYEYRVFDAFEAFSLNQDINIPHFDIWSCYGMILSAILAKEHPEFLNNRFSWLSNAISDNIWNSVEPLHTEWNIFAEWNKYTEVTKTILGIHLLQSSKQIRDLEEVSIKDPTKIFNTIRDNPWKTYVLNFHGNKKDSIFTKKYDTGHTVIPYRADDNNIYIWDPNVPYSKKNNELAYNQYIYIDIVNNTWEAPRYKDSILTNGWIEFTDIELMEVGDLHNVLSNPSPVWFSETDTLFTLSGSADLLIIDWIGNISWFINGSSFSNIEGVEIIKRKNASLDTVREENIWKQIYLPQKRDDLTVHINGKVDEDYTLMIAWGDYYTKVEWVSTSSGQTDTFVSTRTWLEIDFDDNKTWDYNLLTDNFYNSGTGTIYFDSIQSTSLTQQYNFDWTKVRANDIDAVTYTIDTDNNGLFDETPISLPAIYQDLIAPITNIELDGLETPSSTGSSYYDTLDITLTATDNTDGTGVKAIYYAIWTGTWELTYLPYTDTMTINGVGEYTFNYYSVDNFWNIEENKIENFTLVEQPETYAGKISGYTFFDTNQDQTWDTDEATNAGWKICIDENENGTCEENTEEFMVTNNTWYYEFDWLATGIYTILIVPRQNWIITTMESYTINLSNWQDVEDKNYWNYKEKGKKYF